MVNYSLFITQLLKLQLHLTTIKSTLSYYTVKIKWIITYFCLNFFVISCNYWFLFGIHFPKLIFCELKNYLTSNTNYSLYKKNKSFQVWLHNWFTQLDCWCIFDAALANTCLWIWASWFSHTLEFLVLIF